MEICVKRGSRFRAILCKGDAECGAKERNAKNIEKQNENEGSDAEIVENVTYSRGRFMRKSYNNKSPVSTPIRKMSERRRFSWFM